MPGQRAIVAPTSGAVRVVRAAVLGGLSLTLATGAHTLGGGSLPGVGVLVVVALVLGLLAAVVTARRCRFAPLLGVLAAQQIALHELFMLAGSARACTLQAPEILHAGHAGAMCAPGAMTMATGVPDWSMTAAHLVAVLVTAWLLARGEAWLWRSVERVAAAAGLRIAGGEQAHRRTGRALPVLTAAARSTAWVVAAPRGPPPALA